MNPYATQYEVLSYQFERWIQSSPNLFFKFLKKSFPIFQWLPKYPARWIVSDMIAGVTCGLIMIPSAFASANLASVPIQYGLYTCFGTILFYPIFGMQCITFGLLVIGTSKDISIGATAVLATVMGQSIAAHSDIDPIIWAASVCFVSGLIQLLFGLLGLGIVVDFIPSPVIHGFMTGASLSVIIGQIPPLFGIPDIVSNESPIYVLYHSMENISKTHLDAAFGFSSMIFLLILKYISQHYNTLYPWTRWIGVCKNAITVLLFTLISFLVNRNQIDNPSISIVKSIPSGFSYIKAPQISSDFWDVFGSAMTLVLVGSLEHMAIVKCFGRKNRYTADPSQEFIALGIGNITASFLGGIGGTGSFSKSSISSQCGSKSPLSTLFTSLIILGALFFLMPLLYYMPLTVLSSIIILAMYDLIASPASMKQLFQVDVFEFFLFLIVILATLFFSMEYSIYFAIGLSILLLLLRIARPHWSKLVKDVKSGLWIPENELEDLDSCISPDGILVLRIDEALLFPNSDYLSREIKNLVQQESSPCYLGQDKNPHWYSLVQVIDNQSLPRLNAILFDFSSVSFIDYTALQMLSDLERDLSCYCGQRIPFHFAHVKHYLLRRMSFFVLEMNHTPSDSLDVFDEVYNHQIQDFMHKTIDDGLDMIRRNATMPRLKTMDKKGTLMKFRISEFYSSV